MAATRKLQGEIDRCLKKVAEGVETFEDIWKKVHNATNSNQKVYKEKYEADLKKEIKKLQRLRDQIKSWIASGEIKDKSALLDNRRLIETQMERFKIVERETKTKAYSKEGLGAAQKMDPAQRIKDDARNWLTTSISSLQIQIDQYESEIESLLAGKKKRLDRDKQDRMDELRSKLDRHKFHVTKLETLLRLLDNDGVEAEQVHKIKDDVEYYIDSSQEPDFEENEFIYDDIIGLDEVELSGTATTDSNNSNETSGSPSSITSGTSPVQSPPPAQAQHTQQQQPQPGTVQPTPQAQAQSLQQQPLQSQSNSTNLSYANDTTVADGATCEKRSKNENAAVTKTKQPVKPTAVRAASNKSTTSTTNDAPGTKIVSSTPSKIHHTQQQPPQQQPTAAAVVAASMNAHVGNNLSTPGAPTLAATVAGHGTTAQHGQLPNMNVSTAAVVAASATANQTVITNNTIQGQSVIPPSTTIAFAAVAKNNSSHMENGVTHPATSYAMAAPTVASIVGSTTQQQQQQLSNLQTNSSHLQNGLPSANNNAVESLSLKTMAQEAINRSTIETNTMAQPPALDVRQSQHQQQQQQVLQQHFASDSTANQQQQQAASVASVVAASAANGPSTGAGPGVTSIGGLNTSGQSSGLNTSTSGIKQHQPPKPTSEAHIPPLLGVAPLGPSLLSKEHQMQFQMMEAAYYHLPTPSDSEKLTTYFHRTPVQTPAHYPQSQLPIYDTVEFYQRLSTETLFFVFYYMEGSKAQYLAAKALKKQSWRFHTKYMMWFQRHEEPKIINDDYEQGTYIYFDYEKWSQRKKEGFTFEYKYLEDKELN
ncbi:CCR4-NOT transcription complex subunit 3 isoform X2 [Teleopsis dalmanni]|uniref:CCR4-NOT transcription complex subunit 3 isoform X2 n=1 Tax=Teleopsis dalmanni TaxID=139649 RepID=UPI0018CEC753|nr:CCR4-NOT transcription complex subunit 3 isoform X2 [Teleopsis dalmanni]